MADDRNWRKGRGRKGRGGDAPGWNASASGGSYGGGGGYQRGGFSQGDDWDVEGEGGLHEGRQGMQGGGGRPRGQGRWRGQAGTPESWVGRAEGDYQRPRQHPDNAWGTRPQGWREDGYTLGTDRQQGEGFGNERGPFTGRGPAGYTRSDERIREDVCDRLTQHGGIDATEIRVDVAQGEVTLEGQVGERVEKFMAEEVADTVVGVREVHNRIRLRGRGDRPSGREEVR